MDTPILAASEPPWLTRARGELGTGEAAGAADNARVVAYYRDAGHPEIAHDSVAWCAAFASAMLERSGVASPRTLRARNFLQWGASLDAPRAGCIVVLWRGSPSSDQGHVGFFAGMTGDRLLLLGGNQSDQVSLAAFPRNQVLGFRWPIASVSIGGADSDDIFEQALAHVLDMEGGWTDDAFDPGGPTNKGITLAELARWARTEVSADTVPALRVAPTRHRQSHRPPDLPRQLLAARLLRGSAGPDRALPFRYRPSTKASAARRAFCRRRSASRSTARSARSRLAAAAEADPSDLIEAYSELRRDHYRGLAHFWRFGRGWLNRVDATRKAALKLAAWPTAPKLSPSSQPSRKELDPMPTVPNSTLPQDTKWWGHSITIWGVIVTTLTTVLPIVARALGYDLSAQVVQDLGSQLTALMQALGGIAGIVMTIVGRARATQPLNLGPGPLRARDWRRE